MDHGQGGVVLRIAKVAGWPESKVDEVELGAGQDKGDFFVDDEGVLHHDPDALPGGGGRAIEPLPPRLYSIVGCQEGVDVPLHVRWPLRSCLSSRRSLGEDEKRRQACLQPGHIPREGLFGLFGRMAEHSCGCSQAGVDVLALDVQDLTLEEGGEGSSGIEGHLPGRVEHWRLLLAIANLTEVIVAISREDVREGWPARQQQSLGRRFGDLGASFQMVHAQPDEETAHIQPRHPRRGRRGANTTDWPTSAIWRVVAVCLPARALHQAVAHPLTCL